MNKEPNNQSAPKDVDQRNREAKDDYDPDTNPDLIPEERAERLDLWLDDLHRRLAYKKNTQDK